MGQFGAARLALLLAIVIVARQVGETGLRGIVEKFVLDAECPAVVAIPACNEEARIGDCLAALAVQRDEGGAPLADNVFAVLVFANNCTDDTAARVRQWQEICPFRLIVSEAVLPVEQSNAGFARKMAMDQVADLLLGANHANAVIMTTDADSSVCSTWVSRTLAEIARGADAVAGYIEAHPAELLGHGRAFVQRGRLEDTYLAQIAEIGALCDPLPYDPWPNHRVSSGASLAVKASAYQAIGGLPPKPVGEDAALTECLMLAGYKVRHAMDIVVTTSCRLEGRAPGGAADTMRFRRDNPDAACDADIEPLARILRRALWKGRTRRRYDASHAVAASVGRLGLSHQAVDELAANHRNFEAFWRGIEATSPRFGREPALRPSQLPGQIELARRTILRLRERGPATMCGALAPSGACR